MSADSLILLLKSFNLTTMAQMYDESLHRAEKENWGYRKFLQYLCENEFQARHSRKIKRLLVRSKLPEGKTLSALDEKLLPEKCRRMLPTLLDGGFVKRAENILAFGLPGGGKTHFLAALGHELILQHQYNVLFIPTFKLVQELLVAKQKLELTEQLCKYNRYDVIIIDDIGYVQHSRDEMEVLFTFLAERYERKSLMISSNLIFSEWDKIFKDPMTTMAAIDRLVHHSVILEFNEGSIREMQAKKNKK
ncbi:MAG TPA: AAA family ATPase [candidate division Zixibacteria bacterium]|nr:AAA family ATPase [candidate division Zixibacteria bacterium]